MEVIHNWKARRAGGRITINGQDETGAPFKLPNVDEIEWPAGEIGPIAVDKNGERFRLIQTAA